MVFVLYGICSRSMDRFILNCFLCFLMYTDPDASTDDRWDLAAAPHVRCGPQQWDTKADNAEDVNKVSNVGTPFQVYNVQFIVFYS